MNYYERHIGDYLKDTAHLSLLEHGVYSRLLDVYYTRESGIPVAQVERLVAARSKDERAALAVVLDEFFAVSDEILLHARCDREIKRYQAKAERNREVGKLGGRPRKTKTQLEPTDNHDGFKQEPTDNPPQSPVTSNQTPYSVAKATGDKSPKLTDPDEIIFGYGLALLVSAGNPEKTARSFLGGLSKEHGPEALIDKLRECAKAKPLQPLEWLAAALPPKGGRGRPNAQESLEAANRAVVARLLEKSHAPQ